MIDFEEEILLTIGEKEQEIIRDNFERVLREYKEKLKESEMEDKDREYI